MSAPIVVDRANTILYCERWPATVAFYRDVIGLDTEFENDWFVEFRLGDGSYLSVADAARATIEPSGGHGITLAWRTPALAEARARLIANGVDATPITRRWDADVVYCHDPDGHRIELWSAPTP